MHIIARELKILQKFNKFLLKNFNCKQKIPMEQFLSFFFSQFAVFQIV